MTKKILLIVLNLSIIACIVLIGLAPIIPTAIAAEVADAYGCKLDESGVHPCLINGVDYGETLLTMGMMAWLAIASIPIAIGLFVIYLVVVIIIAIVAFIVKKRKKVAEHGNRPTT
jgi:ABC-type antimicrobial peptide transport system permease subunit